MRDQLRRAAIRNRARLAPFIGLFKAIERYRAERRLRIRHPGARMIAPGDLDREIYGSSLGQDRFAIESFPPGFSGVFLDIGCNHPVVGNNSWSLERAGWTGYAFDPQSRFRQDWAECRRTPFFQAAIGATPGVADFVEFEVREGWEHVLSGFLETADRVQLEARPHRVVKVRTGPVASFVPELRAVDLALIDVEGAENAVLDGLGSIRPGLIIIENNRVPGGDEDLRSRLIGNGYEFVARLGHVDDAFLAGEQGTA